MLTVQIEGQANRVTSFINDLQQRPQIEVERQESQYKEIFGNEDVKVTCYVRHSLGSNVRRLSLLTTNGNEVVIPLLDLIEVELEEGKKIIAGRSFDIFG